MKVTQQLHDLGQRIWLDNMTRELMISGTLQRYISDYAVTGLTSNPTIFHNALKGSSFYDESIRKKFRAGKSAEEIFIELAVADLTKAADLFRPLHDDTAGLDGWVSLEVPPSLAYDTAAFA
jgi:transaldolase